MNLILCGPPFSGKSTVGNKLAKTWGRPFIETDDLIEQHVGMNKSAFYRQAGEQEFRRVEQDILNALPRQKNAVIALGGGVTTVPSLGMVVYLEVPIDILWMRLMQSGRRPAYLEVEDPYRHFFERISMRLARYQEMADYIVLANKTVPGIIEEIDGIK